MIIIGRAIEETESFNYSKDCIDNARNKIKQYPTLDKILDNFKDANNENYNKNYFLLLAKSAVSNPFINGNPDTRAEAKLEQYENLINSLRIDRELRSKLFSRMKGFGENHFKIVLELELLLELQNNKLVKNIEYENPDIGTHDFQIILDNTEFNLELTALGEGAIQEILQEAFDLATNEIIHRIPKNTLLRLTVDTSSVLDVNGNNDSNVIHNIVKEKFIEIEPLITIIRNDFCIIERNLGGGENSLYELKDFYKHYGKFGERLLKLLETEDGISFLKSTKMKEIKETPFSSFIIGDAKTKLVEIHSESHWTSKAESLRKQSLLRQFRNGIIEKIKKGQLKGKSNPIIVFNFNDVIFHEYTSDNDIFGQELFDELKGILESIFKQEQEKEILGILLYEETLKKSKFVKNPNIDISDNMLSKIELLKNS